MHAGLHSSKIHLLNTHLHVSHGASTSNRSSYTSRSYIRVHFFLVHGCFLSALLQGVFRGHFLWTLQHPQIVQAAPSWEDKKRERFGRRNIDVIQGADAAVTSSGNDYRMHNLLRDHHRNQTDLSVSVPQSSCFSLRSKTSTSSEDEQLEHSSIYTDFIEWYLRADFLVTLLERQLCG